MDAGNDDLLRGRDARRRERRLIRYLSRGMTPLQRRLFQRTIEDTKRSVGLGGRHQLLRQQLELIRADVLHEAGGERNS